MFKAKETRCKTECTGTQGTEYTAGKSNSRATIFLLKACRVLLPQFPPARRPEAWRCHSCCDVLENSACRERQTGASHHRWEGSTHPPGTSCAASSAPFDSQIFNTGEIANIPEPFKNLGLIRKKMQLQNSIDFETLQESQAHVWPPLSLQMKKKMHTLRGGGG